MQALARHPGRHLSSPEACGEAEAGRAHGEVTDEIPDQTSKLNDGRKEGENRAVKLNQRSAGTSIPHRFQIRTFRENTRVRAMDPKYAAVKGNRGVERR